MGVSLTRRKPHLFMIRFTAIDAKFAPPQYVPIQKGRPSYSSKAPVRIIRSARKYFWLTIFYIDI